MEKFTTLRSGVVPLPIENVDTDQIIPARFLKATTREGFGENLFADWRYAADGQPKPDFVLNDARYQGHQILLADAGFELREPGCSACLAMNEDKIPAGAYCVSTSNRNFEGRQGPGARTLLASPLVAAITAVEGRLVDVAEYV